MTWHKVSDREPPKDGRLYRFCGRLGAWGDAAWVGGVWVDEAGEPYDFGPLSTDEWTLAPGQEAEAEGDVSAQLASMLIKDNRRMRAAGCALAELAIYVVRERDGIHRLARAASAWAKVIADEGGRDLLPKPLEVEGEVCDG